MNLKIGKYIKYALSSLSIPVFPVGQDGSNNGDSYPAPSICYKRNSFSESSDKDGIYEGSVPVAIDVAARTYDELIDILCQVQQAIHAAPATWNAQASSPSNASASSTSNASASSPSNASASSSFRISDQSVTFGEESYDPGLAIYVCEVTAQIETQSIPVNTQGSSTAVK